MAIEITNVGSIFDAHTAIINSIIKKYDENGFLDGNDLTYLTKGLQILEQSTDYKAAIAGTISDALTEVKSLLQAQINESSTLSTTLSQELRSVITSIDNKIETFSNMQKVLESMEPSTTISNVEDNIVKGDLVVYNSITNKFRKLSTILKGNISWSERPQSYAFSTNRVFEILQFRDIILEDGRVLIMYHTKDYQLFYKIFSKNGELLEDNYVQMYQLNSSDPQGRKPIISSNYFSNHYYGFQGVCLLKKPNVYIIYGNGNRDDFFIPFIITDDNKLEFYDLYKTIPNEQSYIMLEYISDGKFLCQRRSSTRTYSYELVGNTLTQIQDVAHNSSFQYYNYSGRITKASTPLSGTNLVPYLTSIDSDRTHDGCFTITYINTSDGTFLESTQKYTLSTTFTVLRPRIIYRGIVDNKHWFSIYYATEYTNTNSYYSLPEPERWKSNKLFMRDVLIDKDRNLTFKDEVEVTNLFPQSHKPVRIMIEDITGIPNSDKIIFVTTSTSISPKNTQDKLIRRNSISESYAKYGVFTESQSGFYKFIFTHKVPGSISNITMEFQKVLGAIRIDTFSLNSKDWSFDNKDTNGRITMLPNGDILVPTLLLAVNFEYNVNGYRDITQKKFTWELFLLSNESPVGVALENVNTDKDTLLIAESGVVEINDTYNKTLIPGTTLEVNNGTLIPQSQEDIIGLKSSGFFGVVRLNNKLNLRG